MDTETEDNGLPGVSTGAWYVGQYNSTGYKFAIVIGKEQLMFINETGFQSVEQFLRFSGVEFEVYKRRYVESWQKV